MNAQRQLFQTHRIEDVLCYAGQTPVDETIHAVLAAVSDFAASYPQQDDLTLLALRYQP
jgi:serine phosphatase RsbU (regulator of sigma subunit)